MMRCWCTAFETEQNIHNDFEQSAVQCPSMHVERNFGLILYLLTTSFFSKIILNQALFIIFKLKSIVHNYIINNN